MLLLLLIRSPALYQCVYRVEIRVGGGRKGATWKLVLKLKRWDYLNILLISSPKTMETWGSQ